MKGIDGSLTDRLDEIVGAGNFSDAPEVLENYASDQSMAPAGKASCVAWPSTADDVQKIVQLANKKNVPIVPRSSGVGFTGGAIPGFGGVVVDMSRMNRILEIDPRNRMARIEPGVTYGQLQEALAPYNLRSLNPLLPHSTKSVLSSHLERETKLIPKDEYGDPVLTMEIVLGTGDIFRTGSAATHGAPDNTIADLVGTHGPGLDYNRLFQGAQGTFGIVTWMALKVEHISAVEKVFFIPFAALEDIVKPLYRIQRKMLGNECLVLDRRYLASILAGNRRAEEPEDKLPPWTLILCLSGSPWRPEEKVAVEEETLFEIGDEYGLNIGTAVPGAEGLESIVRDRLRQPWPADAGYWRFGAQGSCIAIRCHTQLDKVAALTEAVCDHVSGCGYPLSRMGQYLQPVDRARISVCEYGLSYNREDPVERSLVEGLYKSVSELLYDHGALLACPYGIQSEIVYGRNAALTKTMRQLKDIFDPNNIMNPGKLCF